MSSHVPDVNLLPVLNKIAALSVDKPVNDFLQLHSQKLDPTTKESIIKESKVTFSSLSATSETLLPSFLESKVAEVSILQNSLNELGIQLKQLSKVENTLLQERIKLNQTIEALAISSQQYQDICRAQQRKNKSTTEEVERLAREEVERTSKLRESCEESLRDVRVSVEGEERLLGEKKSENEQLRARIQEFKSHLVQRKQQLDAYRRSKALQAQIDETKKQRFLQVLSHRELQKQAYESNLERQRAKIREVEDQIKMFAGKFSEFEGIWSETRDMFATVEGRCQEVAAKAYAMEAQNQKLFGKAESRQLELERVLQFKMTLDTQHQQLLTDCAEAEMNCRMKQMERAELTKSLQRLRTPGVIPEVMTNADGSIATTTASSSSSSSSSSTRRHRRMDPSSPAS